MVQQIIWAKGRQILTLSWFTWQPEPCFFGWKRQQKPPRIADDDPSTIWHIPTAPVGQHADHPTSKSVEVFAIPMRQHTRRGEICLEPFCGSGSQLIVAAKFGADVSRSRSALTTAMSSIVAGLPTAARLAQCDQHVTVGRMWGTAILHIPGIPRE